MNIMYVKFIGFLNEIAEKSQYGFKSLSNLTRDDENFKGIIYNDRTFVQKEIQTLHKAVRSSSKEIISNSINHLKTWNDVWDCYGVEVTVVKQDFDVWMKVKQMSDKSFKAIVKDGRWYNGMYLFWTDFSENDEKLLDIYCVIWYNILVQRSEYYDYGTKNNRTIK